jgi:hypothetical protein
VGFFSCKAHQSKRYDGGERPWRPSNFCGIWNVADLRHMQRVYSGDGLHGHRGQGVTQHCHELHNQLWHCVCQYSVLRCVSQHRSLRQVPRRRKSGPKKRCAACYFRRLAAGARRHPFSARVVAGFPLRRKFTAVCGIDLAAYRRSRQRASAQAVLGHMRHRRAASARPEQENRD